jgi:hypothetical protein
VDTFVNSIYLYDGNEDNCEDSRVEIYCNASSCNIKLPLDQSLKGSSKGHLLKATHINPNPGGVISVGEVVGMVVWFEYPSFNCPTR